ncbi:hypothetical protein BV20DRAFT_968496 [Pilatotrama ljubarskyi]|nr:hypothetical protein BV20DRAFT_968496 [Pilatotrama ljubarskyi]
MSPHTPQDLDPRAAGFTPGRALAKNASSSGSQHDDVDLNQYMKKDDPASPSSVLVQVDSSADGDYARSLQAKWEATDDRWLEDYNKGAAEDTRDAEKKGQKPKSPTRTREGANAGRNDVEETSARGTSTDYETKENSKVPQEPSLVAPAPPTLNTAPSQRPLTAADVAEAILSPSRGVGGASPPSESSSTHEPRAGEPPSYSDGQKSCPTPLLSQDCIQAQASHTCVYDI